MTKSPAKRNTGRQPPVQAQFKPGQSGNPAGRPKGSRNKVTRGGLDRIILEEAARAAPGGDGVSMHRAVVRKLFAKAAMGALGAAALILPLAAGAEATVAELDDAAEARAAEAAAAADRAAAAERDRAAAADDAALAARLAAEDPALYHHARELISRSKSAFSKPEWLNDVVRRSGPLRFTAAVEIARVQIAIGNTPFDSFDPHLAAAALAAADGDEDDGEEDEEEEEEAEENKKVGAAPPAPARPTATRKRA